LVKSEILKKLRDNYPNFQKKDLEKFFDIFINEIKQSLQKGERVEFRGFGIWSTKSQKARISRNPKTGEKVQTPKKTVIHFKMAKEIFKKVNEND